MIKQIFVTLALGGFLAHANGTLPTEAVMRKCATDLAAPNPTLVREALQKLIYLPLDPAAPVNTSATKHALRLLLTSSDFGNMAALVYMRLTRPADWARIRTVTDFARLPKARRAQFKSDLMEALVEVPFVGRADVREVAPITTDEWVVRGQLTYTRRLSATVFGESLNLNTENIKDERDLVPSFGGRNVVAATYRVRLPAPQAAELAFVDFEVRYAPGADENRRQPIVIDTIIADRSGGRLLIQVPVPERPLGSPND